MFEFSQYLGFLAFLTILTIGFWLKNLLIFLLTMIVPYWIYGGTMELLRERKAKKQAEQE